MRQEAVSWEPGSVNRRGRENQPQFLSIRRRACKPLDARQLKRAFGKDPIGSSNEHVHACAISLARLADLVRCWC